MTPKLGQFPFCRPIGGVVGPGTLYPVGFSAAQMFDLLHYIHQFDFNLSAFSDNSIGVLEAMNYMNIGQVQAMDVAGVIIGNAFSGRAGVAGSAVRYDSGGCNGTFFRHNENLCQVFIDLSDVLRDNLEYYPKTAILFYAANDVFTSYAQGSGGISIGGIDIVVGGSHIVEMYPASASALSPVVLGTIRAVDDRYDALTAVRVGSNVEIEGITFERDLEPRVDRVRFGGVYASSFTLSADKKKITAPIPANAPYDNIVVETKFMVGSNEFRNNMVVPTPFKP